MPRGQAAAVFIAFMPSLNSKGCHVCLSVKE